MSRWAVVGGGMLGMELARRLADDGHAVTLLERARSWAAWPRRGS